MNKKRTPQTVFVSADPPMPPTGGGNRAYHLLRAIGAISSCKLFIIFPFKKNQLPEAVLTGCTDIVVSKVPFSVPERKMLQGLIFKLRLLINPLSFGKIYVIKLADYYASHRYSGNSYSKRILYGFIRQRLVNCGLRLYRQGYSFPSRSLERYYQFKDVESNLLEQLKGADLLWVDFSYLLPLFKDIKEAFPLLKIVCNAHNIEYRYLDRISAFTNDKLHKNWVMCQAEAMRKAELSGFAFCDLIITCSVDDKVCLLNELPNAHVKVIPNGVDVDFFKAEPVIPKEPTLLFTGTMNYEPNIDAVHYFVKEIFPLVKKELPACRLILAGANAGEVFKEYTGREDIVLVNSPKDMRPSYNQANVFIVPLRSGSGTRLKILEAMAMKKPIVSTSIGAEGIEISDEPTLLIADTEKEFSEKVVSILKDKSLNCVLVENGLKLVANVYDWKLIREKLSKYISQLLMIEEEVN